MSLNINSVYLVLYYLRIPVGSERFHWGLVVKSQDCAEGMLLHACNTEQRWHFEAKLSTFEVAPTSVLALKIGTIHENMSWIHLVRFSTCFPSVIRS